jgi:hypothetical protein
LRIADGRQDAFVEDVEVQMQPRRTLSEPSGGVGPHPGGAALAHLERGEGPDGWVEAGVLAGHVGVKLGRAEPEQHDSGRVEQRAVSLEQSGRAMTGENRELHVGRLAGRRTLPVKKSACPSTNQRPLPRGSAWKTPSRSVQSPPRMNGDSRAFNTSRTREAIASDPRRTSTAPTTPVSRSRRVSRMRASASPASRARRRSTSPAARSEAGARSSPRPVPEQSIGASTTAKRAIPSHSCAISSIARPNDEILGLGRAAVPERAPLASSVVPPLSLRRAPSEVPLLKRA